MRTDRCCNFLRENAGDDVANVQLHPNVLVIRGKITAFYGFPQSLHLGIFTLLPSKTRLMIDIFVGLFCLETTIGVGLVWLPVGAHFAFRPTCWGIPLLFGFGLSLFLSRARIPKDIIFFAVTPLPQKQTEKAMKQWPKIFLIYCHTERKGGFTTIFLLNSTSNTSTNLKDNILETIGDRCDSKKHKTLVYTRVRARKNGMLLRWNSRFITCLLHQTAHECICVKALSRNVPRFEENLPHFEENVPRFEEYLPHVGE